MQMLMMRWKKAAPAILAVALFAASGSDCPTTGDMMIGDLDTPKVNIFSSDSMLLAGFTDNPGTVDTTPALIGIADPASQSESGDAPAIRNARESRIVDFVINRSGHLIVLTPDSGLEIYTSEDAVKNNTPDRRATYSRLEDAFLLVMDRRRDELYALIGSSEGKLSIAVFSGVSEEEFNGPQTPSRTFAGTGIEGIIPGAAAISPDDQLYLLEVDGDGNGIPNDEVFVVFNGASRLGTFGGNQFAERTFTFPQFTQSGRISKFTFDDDGNMYAFARRNFNDPAVSNLPRLGVINIADPASLRGAIMDPNFIGMDLDSPSFATGGIAVDENGTVYLGTDTLGIVAFDNVLGRDGEADFDHTVKDGDELIPNASPILVVD